MSNAYIDTDVIIRLLTGDDLAKQAAARTLFEQMEQGALSVTAPQTVIADATYVLHSKRLYNKPKEEVAALLIPLVSLPGFKIANRRAVLTALRFYGAHPHLDFTDALLIALMQHAGLPVVYSYDTDYDTFDGITRQEP